jgi:hypothetical protein
MTITRKIGEVFKITSPYYPYNSAYCRSDNRGAIFVQVANSVPEDKTTISQPSCVFCREAKELKYDLSRGISTICSVRGHLSDEVTIHRRYYFKYCPICGKKL